MTKGAGTLAIIPARAGSVRLPGKNLRALGGKPMIAWTIEAALASASIDAVLVTSDDTGVLALAREMGVHDVVRRPDALATSTATSADVVMHALNASVGAHSSFCLLQPTSPLRAIADIDGAIGLHRKSGLPVVSVCETPHPLAWCVGVGDDGAIQPIDAALPAPTYTLNGAIYALSIAGFRADPRFTPPGTLAYRMPRDRSVDVDTLQEFLLCEVLLKSGSLVV
ncbi:hypothetical protein AB4059_10780 [Lysobacter sp. 2RAF19]